MANNAIEEQIDPKQGPVEDPRIADNFRTGREAVDLGDDVDQRARLKRVGGDQSNGEDALLNSVGDSIPLENPGVGEKS